MGGVCPGPQQPPLLIPEAWPGSHLDLLDLNPRLLEAWHQHRYEPRCVLLFLNTIRAPHEPELAYFKNLGWDFLSGPVAKTGLPMQGARVRSLVGELDPTCCI